jgi:hypothetical protein
LNSSAASSSAKTATTKLLPIYRAPVIGISLRSIA